MLWLRALLFTIIFNVGSTIAVLAAVPAGVIGPKALQSHVMRWSRFFHWCNKAILGIDSRIEGTVPDGPCFFAAKHQSMYETIELIRILREPAIVFKKELADLPVWGWIARRYGTIPVDRNGSAAALRVMLRAAKQAKALGRPIVIFPEGSRVRPGNQPELRPGFAGLYRQLDLPVVPIAIDSGEYWLRKQFIKRPGTITFRFGDPIPPGLTRTEAEARVHAGINALEP